MRLIAFNPTFWQMLTLFVESGVEKLNLRNKLNNLKNLQGTENLPRPNFNHRFVIRGRTGE